MYSDLEYWELEKSPFVQPATAAAYYATPSSDEALARMQYLAERGRRLGLLVGESGNGKSLLLRVFASQLRRQAVSVCEVDLLGMGTHELLWSLATQLGATTRSGATTFDLWESVADELRQCVRINAQVAILVDNADQITGGLEGESDGELLALLARLSQMNPAAKVAPLTILAANPDMVELLGRRLLELVELRIDLPAWELSETWAYIKSRLEQTGCQTDLFTTGAVEQIERLTGGVPRKVNQLADLALVAAAGQQLSNVGGDTILKVHGELMIMPRSVLPDSLPATPNLASSESGVSESEGSAGVE